MEFNGIEIDEHNIITLTLEDGQELEFVEIAFFPFKNKDYSFLQLLYEADNIPEKTIFIFEVSIENDGEKYSLVEDTLVIDQVAKHYQNLLQKQSK